MWPDDRYLEKRPAHRVNVGDFLIEEVAFTTREFAELVSATDYRMLAEYPRNPPNYPHILPEMVYAGSFGFHSLEAPIERRHRGQWWVFRTGADWRHPRGSDGGNEGLDDPPAVQVSYDDALIYPRRKGKDQPTDAEWAFAAQGGWTRSNRSGEHCSTPVNAT